MEVGVEIIAIFIATMAVLIMALLKSDGDKGDDEPLEEKLNKEQKEVK